jgi:hypothetical protein
VLNVGSALALTGAGVAGSPALFASGNITISDGAALNGAGTLSLGSYTLATEFSGGSNYSYTGGLWAQLESTPTFSGGTLTLGSEGVYTFTVGASMIITFAPSANDVTYDLSEVVVSGTLDLRNTHGTRPMIVQLASGVSYTTANNTGAAITVSLPTVNQEVTISGLSNTMRIQIYDESTIAPAGSRELYNGIPGTSSYTWTDSIAAVASRDIRLRVTETDMTPGVPIIMIDQTIGTCGTAEGTEAISFTVAETIDSVYEANNIDGSTITGITITDSTLRMEIDSGTVTTVDGVNVVLINVKNLYAYETYWLGTEEGIRDEARFINATDPANYGFVSFKLRNDTAYPVGIVGGYVKDVATDSCFSLPDYSGGPINFLPDHVVNNIVTITGGNVITGDISDVPTVAEIVAGVVSDSDTLTVGKFVALS